MPSERLVIAVKGFEGFRAVPYMDSTGKWTWGYGSTQGPHPTQPLTEGEADLILRAELAQCEVDVGVYFPRVRFLPGELDATTDFLFNIGPGKGGVKDGLVFLESGHYSTLYECIAEGRKQEAATQFKLWVHAGGKILPGLVKRRAQEVQWWQEK